MSNADLEFGGMVDLLGLELSGVKVVAKEPGAIGRRVAGKYSFFSPRISLNREIIPYWFTALMTLLHEYGHHKHRRFVLGCVILAILAALGLWTYSMIAPSLISRSLTIFLGAVGVLVVAFPKASYFETIADRYASGHVPSIFLFLSNLEMMELVERLQDRKVSLPQTLGGFYRNMREYNPELLE